jgi:hypothetical protein
MRAEIAARGRRAGRVLTGVRFRPAADRPLTVAAVLAFCALGVWQVRRHVWRSADLARKRAASAPVTVAEASATPTRTGAPAARPLRAPDTILVGPIERGHAGRARVHAAPARGRGDGARACWSTAARAAVHTQLPAPESGERRRVVRGLALPLALRDAVPGTRAQRRTHFPRFSPDRPGLVAKLAAQLPYPLAAVMVQSSEPEPAGLPIGEAARPVSPVDHRGYALTWFAVGAFRRAGRYGRRRAGN